MSDVPANLTLEEAAAIIGIPTAALTRLATGSTPRIGSLKIGNVRVYPPSVIAAYIKANTTTPPPPNTWGLTDRSANRSPRSRK